MRTMRAYTILPLVDLIFLAFGGALCCMTQMEVVQVLPVELARVGSGSAVVKHGKFSMLRLTKEGMYLDSEPVSEENLQESVKGRQVVMRVEGNLATSRTIQVMGALFSADAEVSLEVETGGNEQ